MTGRDTTGHGGRLHPDRLEVASDLPTLFRNVSDHFVFAAQQALRLRDRFTVTLSGGGTPKGLHQMLVSDDYRDQIDWSRVHFFWGDERGVSPDHADSNYRMAKETLLDPLSIASPNVHRIPTELGDWPEVAARYEAELAKFFEINLPGPPPQFDLVLLGMGDDGHTASLFPNSEALDERQHWVVANHVPQLKTQRITLTAACINAAREVWFLVTGANKANCLREVLEGPHDPRRLPSQLVRPTSGTLRWFVDNTAAARLTR